MKKTDNIVIRKASGKDEYFSFQKLKNSLVHSNASEDEANGIIQKLKPQLYHGISTKEIYKMAFRMLKKMSPPNASRYYLKKGIMELGPAGFAFEKFIGELFKKEGFSIEVDVMLNGKCVTHEIDVICKKDNLIVLVECKYKNIQGVSVDVKVPLYIHSRFQDVLENNLQKGSSKKFKGRIVTNSRFTEDAISYCQCKGIEFLGWDVPFKNSLKDIIDRTGLYPLTCLTSLTMKEKKDLLDKGIVLVKELCENEKLLRKIGISEKRIKTVINEGTKLIQKS